jgi:RES domain-containing protein
VERPFSPELLDALESKVRLDWSGRVWRQVFDGTPPLRPNVRGSRWNPPDVEALYCSLEPETTAAEIAYLISLQPVPIRRSRVTFALDVALAKLVDLSDSLGSSNDGPLDMNLMNDDSGVSQDVGAAVAWFGYGGLLVPSMRCEGTNLVIFVNNLEPDDVVQELGGHGYPPGPPGNA